MDDSAIAAGFPKAAVGIVRGADVTLVIEDKARVHSVRIEQTALEVVASS
jgi:hypothetical protein